MVKLSLNKDLNDSFNPSNIFSFVPCPDEHFNCINLNSPDDSEDDSIPEDFTFIPGPRF